MNAQQPHHVLVLTSWPVDEPLVRSYVLPYLEIIHRILPEGSILFLVTWDRRPPAVVPGLPPYIRWISVPYSSFGVRAMVTQARTALRLAVLIHRENVRTLHPFAPPAGFIALVLHRLTGRRVVMDSWEPHADAMVETGTWEPRSAAYRLLKYAERALSRESEYLIAAAQGMEQYAERAYGGHGGRVLYRPACVDPDQFNPERFPRALLRKERGIPDHSRVGICASKLGGLYEYEAFFLLVRACVQVFGRSFRMILLSSNDPQQIAAGAAQAQVPEGCLIHRFVPHSEVPSWMAMADFAVNPQRQVPSRRFGTPVKDGEYWAMGLPVMLYPDISEDSGLVEQFGAGVLIRKDHLEDTAREMERLLEREPAPVHRIREMAVRVRGFHIAEKAYREAYGFSKV